MCVRGRVHVVYARVCLSLEALRLSLLVMCFHFNATHSITQSLPLLHTHGLSLARSLAPSLDYPIAAAQVFRALKDIAVDEEVCIRCLFNCRDGGLFCDQLQRASCGLVLALTSLLLSLCMCVLGGADWTLLKHTHTHTHHFRN